MIFKTIVEYIKVKKIVDKIVDSENLLDNLSKLFSSKNNNYEITFKKDWLSRIYVIINPVVSDPNSRIFEYDTQGTNINSFVRKWVMEHMLVAEGFIRNKVLFEVLTYDIKQVDENYNFLLVFSPLGCEDFIKAIKKLAIIVGVSLALIIALVIILCLI